MDFAYSEKTRDLCLQVQNFFDDHILPRNELWHKEVSEGKYPVSFMEDLKALAKSEGLWNLFLPNLQEDEPGTRLTNLEYAPLAEIMGKLMWASEVFNCNAPDTGNMEVLARYCSEEQKEKWLTGRFLYQLCWQRITGGDLASTPVTKPEVHAERVVTLVKKSL